MIRISSPRIVYRQSPGLKIVVTAARTFGPLRNDGPATSRCIHNDAEDTNANSPTKRFSYTKRFGYDPKIVHQNPLGFAIRPATLNDVEALTQLWIDSFNPSHKFWEVATPDIPATRRWLSEMWANGIKAGTSKIVTHVVEDLQKDKKLVAYSRFSPPQEDGSQELPIPEWPAEWDYEVSDALWGGMERNRLYVMGKKPHWFGEFAGVLPPYKRRGCVFPLMEWVCRQADAAGVEIYGDGTEAGLKYWKRHFGFQDRRVIKFPKRPDTYGTYEMMSIVRPPGAVVTAR
ncbi:hypothetical protein TWF696_001336 [Orbilia brochopaga]|uniref:N-acetyltransferase domain-containing protein n=1 Tax=Orbilia brochopaga TaxID=3140254 RepID=A0AAV9U956_9PEZI